ncbi:MAG: glycosyltransferase family 2 protein [Planctomycetota bacterium]
MSLRATTVTVTYRSKSTIEGALLPLESMAHSGVAECVVVDNSSDDATADVVEAKFPWVHLVRGEENVGFARACNHGARLGAAPMILFLNPDASIDEKNLGILCDFMEEHPRAAVVSPAQCGDAGELQQSRQFPTPFRILRAATLGTRGSVVITPGDAPRQVEWVCGAVWLVRREAFEELGGFDSSFFMYFEETDFCLRAHKSGWETWVCGLSLARHSGAASADLCGKRVVNRCITKYFYESRFYYLLKHYGRVQAAMAEIGEIVILTLRAATEVVFRRERRNFIGQRLKSPVLKVPAGAGVHDDVGAESPRILKATRKVDSDA